MGSAEQAQLAVATDHHYLLHGDRHAGVYILELSHVTHSFPDAVDRASADAVSQYPDTALNKLSQAID
jgi:hypothetical protein